MAGQRNPRPMPPGSPRLVGPASVPVMNKPVRPPRSAQHRLAANPSGAPVVGHVDTRPPRSKKG